jgi:hypothetical protein
VVFNKQREWVITHSNEKKPERGRYFMAMYIDEVCDY